MYKNLNLRILTVTLLTLTLFMSTAHALIEVQVDCDQFTSGTKPQTARPTTGSVATKPLRISMNQEAGTRVSVEQVEAFKSQAIVVEDQSGGKKGKTASVTFGGSKPSDATLSGKVYFHFDWVTLARKTGNIGFIHFKNAKNKSILSLMFSHNTTGIVVIAGDQVTRLTGVVASGKPVGVDIVLDLDQWHYTILLDGKKTDENTLAKTKDNTYLNLRFSTATSGITSFAIKNIIISPSPID